MLDSMKKPTWNLMQTIGWVYLRDPEIVRAADDGAERGFVPERTIDAAGKIKWIEVQRPPFGIADLKAAARTRGGHFYDSISGAIEALKTELSCGVIVATANRDGEERTSVPANQWEILDFYWSPNFAGPKKLLGEAVGFGKNRKIVLACPQWHQLTFAREQVMASWPAPPVVTDSPKPKRGGGRRAGAYMATLEAALRFKKKQGADLTTASMKDTKDFVLAWFGKHAPKAKIPKRSQLEAAIRQTIKRLTHPA